MRIAIDARFLGTGTGIGRYVEQLILNLEKIDSENIDNESVKKMKKIMAMAENRALLFLSFAVFIVIFNFHSLFTVAYITIIAALLGILYSFSLHFYWIFIKTEISGIENQSENMKGE